MRIYEYFLILKSGLFDKKYYLNQYEDVKQHAKNALYHYIKNGWREGRNPSALFDTNLYLTHNPDVKRKGINPLVHYIRYGKKEGRFAYPDNSIPNKCYTTNQNIIPSWIIEEMKNIGREIDPSIYPNNNRLSQYLYYSYPVHTKPGEIYQKIVDQCKYQHYTHCFALPWLKRGGADFVALQHIEFATKQPNSKVLVVLTEPEDSPWVSRVPNSVDIIDLSKYIWELPNEDFLKVITRLLLQVQIDVLHIINSKYFWDAVKFYGLAIRNKTKIFASLYCDDFDLDGQPVGFARDYLPSCYMHLNTVFTDNTYFSELLHNIYGFKKSLFKVLYSPVNNVKMHQQNPSNNKSILWAGRLDRQKRPDLLLNIAKKIPEATFYIYGEPLLESQKEIIEELISLKNVKMKGAFNGVETLPFDTHTLFLYTSQWDGIPTIIISAALSGIPIVASSVGGIEEVIKNDRGFLINDIEDIDAYVKSIKTIFNEQEKALIKAQNAQKYVKNNHTQLSFFHHLENTPYYIKNHIDSLS